MTHQDDDHLVGIKNYIERHKGDKCFPVDRLWVNSARYVDMPEGHNLSAAKANTMADTLRAMGDASKTRWTDSVTAGFGTSDIKFADIEVIAPSSNTLSIFFERYESLLADKGLEPEFIDYVNDLMEYGLKQYCARYQNEEDFLLWQDYRQDQALLKILENPKHNQYGTYYKNGNIYIFAGLKKDDTVQEHLNYKDKFLDDKTFQWESIAHIKEKDEILQKNAKQAFVFVRKVESENGITLPFTFVGTGQLHNPRKGVTENGSILYDIHMDNKLPADLMEDFKWIA